MRRRFVVALSLCLITSTLLAAEPKLPSLPVESYRLANGLKVVLHRDKSVPRATVCMAYHVGSKDEQAGRTGFAHFFEHMMFRGTKNVPSYDIPLQETGGQSNAFTTEDVTVYYETVPTAFLERALFLESERLAFLPTALDQEKFDTEREVVKNERRQSYENVPYGMSEETILASVFPKGHPYSWSVIGSMDDLNRASLKDLRDFFNEFYHPGNAALCLSGDFDPAAAKALIAKYFEPLAAGNEVKHPPVTKPPAATATIRQFDRVSLPRTYFAWPSVADEHADSAALDLLSDILTGGEASRLHRALVLDSRVATEVSAKSDTKEIGGLFTIESTAAEGKTLKQVQDVLTSELKRLKDVPPTDAELARALAKHEKATYAHLTPPLNRAFVLALGFLQKDDPSYYRHELARYFKVSTADLARVAATYLTPEKITLNIVPILKGETKSGAVKAGPQGNSTASTEPATRAPKIGPDWSKLPGPGETPGFTPPGYVRKTLSNSVDVWIAPWKTLPIVTGRLWIPAGTGDDPAGKTGLAQLCATLLPQGTRDKTATELAESLESLGMTFGSSTDNDSSGLSFSVLARNLEPSLKLLAPTIIEPRFDPADFSRERDLQLASLLQGPDQLGWLSQRAFRALLYGQSHPYGQPVDGFVASVKAITLDDIKAYHRQHFAANQAKLVIAGDVDPEAIVVLLESVLGTWKTKADKPVARPASPIKLQKRVIYLVDRPGSVQSNLRIGRVWTDRNDPSYYATSIGNHVFGVDFLSRLNRNLRERNGFTYGAGSTFVYRRSGSVWVASSSVRSDATAPALREMISELDGIAGKSPLSDEEAKLGRDALTQSFPESFEDLSSIAGVLESMAENSLPADYLSNYLNKIANVSTTDAREVFRKLASSDERTILVVGDRKTIEPKLKALNLGEVKVIDADGKPIAK